MSVISYLFAIFALLGALDRIFGNKFGLGKEFDRGILTVGPLALAMVGMISLSPVLAQVLLPLLTPVAEFLHFDPSVLIACVFANDMGGAPLAQEFAKTPFWGQYNGLVVASMLGVTVSFTIPAALKTIAPTYHKEVLLGILCGISTIPLGCLAAGLLLGVSVLSLLQNLAPVLVLSLLICFGLVKFPVFCVRAFTWIGHLILALVTAGLGIGIFQHITGRTILPGMAPISGGFQTVCEIAILLAGVFPLLFVLSKVLRSVLKHVGRWLQINDTAVMGFLSSLANSIATFEMMDKMDRKGRVMNMAFAVSAAFVFGDHLAFTMAFDRTILPAMILGKLVAGFSALVVAHFIFRFTGKALTEEKK